MARASKTPQRPATAEKPAEKPAPASPAPAKADPPRPAATASASAPSGGLRMTLWIIALALITGAIPAALAGQTFGYWRIPIAAPALPFISGPPVYDAPLAKPRDMVVNATAHIVDLPGSNVALATLEPGFPVAVKRYATQGGARWAQVTWAGPTKAAGGTGWTLAAGLRTPVASGAKPIGDLGALSPAVGSAASQVGSGFAATLYFPDSGYAYHTASAGASVTLGAQIIPIVLVADYGEGLAAKQPSSINQDLVSGNPEALSFVYHTIGAESGMAAYMAHYHISGFHFTTDPAKSTATVQALGQFYTALTQVPLVSAGDQRQIFSLLTGANTSTGPYASPSQIGAGALTVTTAQTDQGYITIITGQLQPTSGPTCIIVAVAAGQPNAAASQDALKAFFKPLFAILG